MAENMKVYTTAVAEALYPKLAEPDYKFKKEGLYSLKLRLSPEDAQPIIDVCQAAADEAYQKRLEEAKNPREKNKVCYGPVNYKEEEDEQGVKTGFYLFNFKMTASGVNQKTGKAWTRTCPVYDSKRSPVNDAVKKSIAGGSLMKVAYTVSPYYSNTPNGGGAAASIRLEAVQLLELKQWCGGRDAKSYGFEEEADYDNTYDVAATAFSPSNEAAVDNVSAVDGDY